MDLNVLLKRCAEKIAQDPDILEWANLHYGRDHTVFVNFDMQNPPGEEYCPYVAIAEGGKRAGQTIRERSHVIGSFLCIHDDEEKAYPGISNIVQYVGGYRAEAFRKLVETAFTNVDVGNATVNFETEFDTISNFPFMWCFMDATFDEQVTMGSDPLA